MSFIRKYMTILVVHDEFAIYLDKIQTSKIHKTQMARNSELKIQTGSLFYRSL